MIAGLEFQNKLGSYHMSSSSAYRFAHVLLKKKKIISTKVFRLKIFKFGETI